jgi:hypothetical protein
MAGVVSGAAAVDFTFIRLSNALRSVKIPAFRQL